MNEKDKEQTLSHMIQIRKYLWKKKGYGHAALMIGAGYSLNAVPLVSSAQGFPQWKALADEFGNALSPTTKIDIGVPPLELAARYEAVFGRTALHELILGKLPDNSFDPGPLHYKILNLPWADVFTTNYDTLLDRASLRLNPDKSYRVIRRVEGIPGSRQPRIVKVHGSFPDVFPLTITEDDFRQYPAKFAPFVNMVQQSMMENIFCLLGFSGDDPNFTNWSGWVRDNLGESTPLIYLCGVFDSMDRSRVDYLRRRNVVVVDLAYFLNADETYGRHEKGIERFLTFLENGQPDSPMSWGGANSNGGPKGGDDDSFGTDSAQLIRDLRRVRENYPGWIVCPSAVRDNYWNQHLERALKNYDWKEFYSLALREKLSVLFELSWGLELSLRPVFSSVREHILSTLSDMSNSDVRKFLSEYISLSLVLVRDAREGFNKEEFDKWTDEVANIIANDTVHIEYEFHLRYERCLEAWYRLEFRELSALVGRWPSHSVSPIWTLRKASLCLVLADFEEGWNLVGTVLADIRTRLNERPEDCQLLSIESWAMFLLECRIETKTMPFDMMLRGRWDELAKYKCDPARELRYRFSLKDVTDSRFSAEHETFDPGHSMYTHSVTFGGRVNAVEENSYISYSRLHEFSGCPMWFGRFRTVSQHIETTLDCLLSKHPTAYLSHVVRFGSVGRVKKLSRFSVLALERNEVSDWYSSTESLPKFLVEKMSLGKTGVLESSRWSVIFQAYLELVSRLSIRLEGKSVEAALNLACGCYRNVTVRHHHELYEPLGNIFKRCIAMLPENSWKKWLPKLLDLPLGGANGTRIALPERWPEPFHYVDLSPAIAQDVVVTESTVSFLLGQVRAGTTGQFGSRALAIVRLSALHSAGLIDEKTREEFADVLWEKKDSVSGLPDLEGHFYTYALLSLPEPQSGRAIQQLKSYLKSRKLVQEAGMLPERPGQVYPPPFLARVRPILTTWLECTKPKWRKATSGDKRRINWTKKEACACIEDTLALWDERKGELEKAVARSAVLLDATRDIRDFFLDLSTLVTKILIPFAKLAQGGLLDKLYRMLVEMKELDVPVQRNLHMLLWSKWDMEKFVFETLDSGLDSEDGEVLASSYYGVCHWALMCSESKDSLTEPPRLLIRKLLSHTLTRNRDKYHILLDVNAEILRGAGDLYTDEDRMALCDALESIARSSPLAEVITTTGTSYNDFSGANYLASVLLKDYERRKNPVPSILESWRSSADETELPDLKEHWHSGDDKM